MASSNDIKNGSILSIDGNLWKTVEFQHVKPGKGGAFVRTKLKNVITGKVVDKTYNAGAKVEIVNIDKRNMQYSYKDGQDFMFMDLDTYDTVLVPKEVVGMAANFMLEGTDATVGFFQENPIFLEIAASAILEVKTTEPGLQGNRSNAGTKPATLETNALVQVPLFINEGDKIKVDTRTGEYVSKA